MHRTLTYGPFVGIALILAGCVAEADDAPTALQSEVLTESYGIVHVSTHAGRTGAGPVMTMNAHFMAFAGVEREALVQGLGLWEPSSAPGCHIVDPPSSSDAVSVQLLDAGTVGLGSTLELEPRSVPSYLPHFHGVLYSTDAPVDMLVRDAGLETIWVAGGSGVSRFATELDAPPAIRLSRVNGEPVGTYATIESAPGQGLELEFQTQSAEAYVEIEAAGSIASTSIRCLVDADVPLFFSEEELSTIFGDETSLTVRAHTAHYTSIPESVGMDGSVVFDYVDTLEIERH